MRLTFRDHQIAALLKQVDDVQRVAVHDFPRSLDRGFIEAS